MMADIKIICRYKVRDGKEKTCNDRWLSKQSIIGSCWKCNRDNYECDERDYIPTSDLAAAQKKLEKAEGLIARFNKAMMGLVVGGSEYYNDPEYCAKRINDRIRTADERARNSAIKAAAVRSELEAVKAERDKHLELLKEVGDYFVWCSLNTEMTGYQKRRLDNIFEKIIELQEDEICAALEEEK